MESPAKTGFLGSYAIIIRKLGDTVFQLKRILSGFKVVQLLEYALLLPAFGLGFRLQVIRKVIQYTNQVMLCLLASSFLFCLSISLNFSNPAKLIVGSISLISSFFPDHHYARVSLR